MSRIEFQNAISTASDPAAPATAAASGSAGGVK